MDESKKHLQLPNNLINVEAITPKDLLVYLALRRYENWETHEAFPSMELIGQVCGCDRRTISSAIKRLSESGFISIRKEGRKNVYTFKKYIHFEPFSLDFLDNDTLTFTEKAYLVAQQQFLFKEDGVGKTTFNVIEMSNKINMSPSTISRCDKSLAAKQYLSIVKTDIKDPETGLFKKEKIFNLEKFGQAVVFVLQNHEERIDSVEQRMDAVEKRLSKLDAYEKYFRAHNITDAEIEEELKDELIIN